MYEETSPSPAQPSGSGGDIASAVLNVAGMIYNNAQQRRMQKKNH